MIDSKTISLMRELVDVQAARAENWPTPHGPADKDLEAAHRKEISAIRKQISARRVAESETPPAVEAVKSSGDLESPRRATWFRRLMRNICSGTQSGQTNAAVEGHAVAATPNQNQPH